MKMEIQKMAIKKIGNTKYSGIILFLLVLITGGISFLYWPGGINRWIVRLMAFLMLLFIVKNNSSPSFHFKKIVLFLAFYPFVTIVTSAIFWKQSVYTSINVLLPHMLWLLYFPLHKYSLSEKEIYKSFLLFSLLILFLQVVQQFTYPDVYWGVYSEEAMVNMNRTEIVDTRNGIYRFRLDENSYTTVFVLLYCLDLLKSKFSIKSLLVVMLMFVSVYLTLTRQVMASCFFVVLLSLLGKNFFSFRILLFLLILALIGWNYYDFLFEDMTSQSKEDLDDDNIRILSYLFYFELIVANFVSFLFGNGMWGGESPFAKLADTWQFDMGLYTVDIGFVGFWFHYGLLYIMIFIYVNYILLVKYNRVLPNYIKYTVLFTLLMSPMIFPYWGVFCYFYWPFILYICDLHINKKLV